MTGASRRCRGDAGFTLTELLVVTVILSVIGFALTEAIILGLRTTDATAASSSRSTSAQTLASYFTDDAQSAQTVSAADGSCATGPVFLHLTWTDQVRKDVSYGLDPVGGDDQDVVRWSCAGGGAPDRRILGHFTRDGTVGAGEPVVVTCDGGDCPANAGAPTVITLHIDDTPALDLTVRRRTAP